MDKPITTKCVSAQTRVYYIDSFADRKGEPYITITEIPKDNKTPGKNKKRQRVFIHTANIDKFLSAFQEVAESIKKNDT